MSDGRPRTTRRAVLGLAGTTVLAGCGGLSNPFDSDPLRLDSAALADVPGSVPAVHRTVPVAVTDGHLRDHVDRTEALLSRAPLPFDASEIPNGAMRQEVSDSVATARSALQAASDAPTPFVRTTRLRNARGHGRAVAAAWAYVDEVLRADDLDDDATALGEDVAAFRDRWTHVGDDPVRALLVHGPIESLANAAADGARGAENPRVARDENLVTVSHRAADLERGRAALADAAHLYDRLRADASATRDLSDAFASAVTEVRTMVETGAPDVGDADSVADLVDADVEGTVVEFPLRYLYDAVSRGSDAADDRDAGDLASALLDAHRDLTRLRAFEDLRTRVEEDVDRYAVERVADVESLRERAVESIAAATRETDHPGLARTALHPLDDLVAHVDSELAQYAGRDAVEVDWLRRDVGDYVYAAGVARATPGADDAVASALASD